MQSSWWTSERLNPKKNAHHGSATDHFTRQGQIITTCTKVNQLKGNLPSVNESVTPVHSVASGEKEQIMLPLSKKQLMLPSSDLFTCQGQIITTCTKIHQLKGNLPSVNESVTPGSQCSKWGKKQLMLPLSDHFTHQGLTITTCTQIHLFKGNLPAEYEQSAPFDSVASEEKEQIMLPLSDHFTHQG